MLHLKNQRKTKLAHKWVNMLRNWITENIKVPRMMYHCVHADYPKYFFSNFTMRLINLK